MQEGTSSSLGHPGETAPASLCGRGDVYAAQCPTRALLDRLADKWTVLVLTRLSEQPMRFNALRRLIEGVSQKMLSQTLRQLERDGMVRRAVVATVPVQVTYSVTPLGQTLVTALQSVVDWAETHMDAVAEAQSDYDARDPVKVAVA